MSFSVYNKLEKPIYIDWKSSSFIYNKNKLNYWIDEQRASITGYYRGYFYNGPLIKPGFAINDGVQMATSTMVKPERVTFIPPKSFYYRSQFYLLPVANLKVDVKAAVRSTVPRNDYPRKQTNVYEQNFNPTTSPLTFRNYLAYSLSENVTNPQYVDNEFYLSSVKEMDYRHFLGKAVESHNGKSTFARPFKKKTSFYVHIPAGYSAERREKRELKK